MSLRFLRFTIAAAATALLVAPGAPAVAQSSGLRSGADALGINFGAAVTFDALADDTAYRQLLSDNVNMVSSVSEFDMAVVQPEPGVFDFTRADALVDFAVENDMAVRGHGLIGARALPDWVVNGSWTPETLTEVLQGQVTEVVGRYADRNPGVITQWDVVDEAFLPDGGLRNTIWQQVIGDEHLRLAFEAAQAADPDALLFYDDFYDDLAVTQDAVAVGAEIVPGATADRSSCDDVPKCVGVRATISALVDTGVPIDGIGVQAHLLSPDPFDLSEFTSWVGGIGLMWAVTEFDVPVPSTEITDPDTLAFQASAYADALQACVDASGCDTFVTWGISDRVPPATDTTGGAFGGGLWFDTADAPKPAFDALAEVLGEAAPEPATTEPTTTGEPAPAATDAPPAASDDSTADSTTAPTGLVVGAVALVGLVVVVALLRGRRASASDAKNP